MSDADRLLASFVNRIPEPVQSVFKESVCLHTCSSKLPKKNLYRYYDTFKQFRQELKMLRKNILSTVQVLLNIAVSIEHPGREPVDIERQDECYRSKIVIDAVDSLLESVDTYLDKSKEEDLSVGKQPSPRDINVLLNNRRVRIIYSNNIARPQDMWRDDVDNSNRPFVPKQINEMIEYNVNFPPLGNQKSNVIDGNENNKHLYEDVLKNLTYGDAMFRPRPKRKCCSIDEVPFIWVSTVSELSKLVSQLNSLDEFAVDLETHEYRSFQGFTCTMQISTWGSDYIVDTLKLRKSINEYLGSVFANPKIVKVFHGASSGILWLQRDFSIYVVNMFDTQIACVELKKPFTGMGYLLDSYFGVQVDKRFQMADWRIRPLPAEMLEYARNDTRYLLNIYEAMLEEALSLSNGREKISAILNRSRDLCLRTYKKEIFSEKSYLKLYSKYEITLEPRELSVFASIFKWRDKTAREHDESLRYVLPNHMLFLIAKYLPKNPCSFKEICSYLPPLLKINLNEVIYLIKKAEKSDPPYAPSPQKNDNGKKHSKPTEVPPENDGTTESPPDEATRAATPASGEVKCHAILASADDGSEPKSKARIAILRDEERNTAQTSGSEQVKQISSFDCVTAHPEPPQNKKEVPIQAAPFLTSFEPQTNPVQKRRLHLYKAQKNRQKRFFNECL